MASGASGKTQGLSAAVDTLKRYHKRELFIDSDIYIDALNFSFTSASPASSRKGTFDWEINQANKMLDRILALRPRSITFVADGVILEEKFQVRVSRQQAKSNPASNHKHGMMSAYVEAIRAREKMTLIFAGSEGEDEIMKLIDEDYKRQKRMQFIISDDSDLFRFRIHNMNPIHIVSTHAAERLLKSNVKAIPTINLGMVARSGRVDKNLLINSPIVRRGQSIVNPRSCQRHYCELVNCGYIYNRIFTAFRNTGSSNNDALEDYAAWDAGVPLRRILYALIIRNNFSAKKDFVQEIEEWRMRGRKSFPTKVQPLESEYVDGALDYILRTPLGDLFRSLLHAVQSEFLLTPTEIERTCQYMNYLASTRDPQKIETAHSDSDEQAIGTVDRSRVIVGVVAAIMGSLVLLSGALPTQSPSHPNSAYRRGRLVNVCEIKKYVIDGEAIPTLGPDEELWTLGSTLLSNEDGESTSTQKSA